jgi:hypothetical protein
MKKILMSILALAFGLGVSTAVLAGDAKADKAVAKACKGKAEGTMVKVDGKDVKCPAPKKK